MTTVLIEIDDVTAKFLREKALDRGVTLGQYVAKLARWDVADEVPRAPRPEGLPPGVDALGRTPEEAAADAARILGSARAAIVPPPGKTIQDLWDEQLGHLSDLDDEPELPAPEGL